MTPLSIILPVRNDAEALARTLEHLVRLPGIETAELIVAACGDPVATQRAVAGRARVLWPPACTRAALLNAGAAAARGATLLFLHADSFPPRDALALIEETLADARVVGGAFAHRFRESGWRLQAISGINRVRYRLTGNYYGDQGLFVRAEVFRRMGGYRPLAILEDLDFSQRLKRLGNTALVSAPLHTSARRFLARGPWQTFCFNVWLLALHTLGLDAQPYAGRYHGPEGLPPGSPWPRGPAPQRTRGQDMKTAHRGAA
jgi:rSAM/selenodomain-associated transferase 2